MAQVTMKEMLDAGVHFGHQTQRWNPKMKNYVYTARGGIHIIDLQKTVVKANKAAEFVKDVAANGGKIIFVGTKKQAVEPIQEAAFRSGQFFVTKRWLGGMMTNFETIKSSIDRLKRIDQMKEKGEFNYFSKKERAKIEKEYLKLSEYLNGIKDMKEKPAAMFVVDLPKEHIAVAEAKTLKIPVIGIADTNSDPESIEFAIPGNDDAIRSIKLFSTLIAYAYIEGAKVWEAKLRTMTDKGSDAPTAEKAERGERSERPAQRKPRPGTGGGERKGAAPAADAVKKPAGPEVVKVQKQRKLVAAGLADEVEIQAELETPSEEDSKDQE
jgi:small subunit ribosomal protein S2